MENATQLFITLLTQELVKLLIPVLMSLLGYVLLRVRAWIDAKTSAELDAQVELLVTMVVRAAEQSGLTGEIARASAAKKEYALTLLQSALRERGLTTLADNVPMLSALIESKINEGVHKWGSPTALSI